MRRIEDCWACIEGFHGQCERAFYKRTLILRRLRFIECGCDLWGHTPETRGDDLDLP